MERRDVVSSERPRRGPTPAGCLSPGTGELLPDVTLTTPSGVPVSLGQYSGRRDLVVALLGAGTAGDVLGRLLDGLARSRAAIDEEEAAVLVVRPADAARMPDDATGAFTVLVDDDAAFHLCVGAVDAAGRAAPALFITDRFREIYHAFRPTDAEWPPSVDEVLSWLVFMNIQCPECGAPEW